MHDGGGKAYRVLGFFFFQLGAGVILDSSADGMGAAIAACGTALFVWGLLQASSRGQRTVPNPTPESSERC